MKKTIIKGVFMKFKFIFIKLFLILQLWQISYLYSAEWVFPKIGINKENRKKYNTNDFIHVKLFVWLPDNKGNVGHSAMAIQVDYEESKNRYISFWPGANGAKKFYSTFMEDYKNEGNRLPEKNFSFFITKNAALTILQADQNYRNDPKVEYIFHDTFLPEYSNADNKKFNCISYLLNLLKLAKNDQIEYGNNFWPFQETLKERVMNATAQCAVVGSGIAAAGTSACIYLATGTAFLSCDPTFAAITGLLFLGAGVLSVTGWALDSIIPFLRSDVILRDTHHWVKELELMNNIHLDYFYSKEEKEKGKANLYWKSNQFLGYVNKVNLQQYFMDNKFTKSQKEEFEFARSRKEDIVSTPSASVKKISCVVM